MARPLFKKRIHQLEELFDRAAGDRKILEELRAELLHRNTARARALLTKVDAALRAGKRTTDAIWEGSGGSTDRRPRERESAPFAPRMVAAPVPTTAESGFSASPPPRERPSSTPAGAREAEVLGGEIDRLLAAWTVLEVLDPPPLPTAKEVRTLRRRMIRADEHDQPWLESSFARRGREREVFWYLYLGEIELATAYASLLRLFPDDSPEKAPRTKGTTALAAVVLDGMGRPVEGKTFLSSFAWGYGKVRAGKLADLPSFPLAERRICSELERRLIRTTDEGEILALTADDVRRVTDWLVHHLDLPLDQVSVAPVAVRVPFTYRPFTAPEPEVLNSFFISELTRVRQAFEVDDVGPALARFVGGVPAERRLDAVRDPAALERVIAPDGNPLSRWPSPHKLVLMQQAAVNHVARELSKPGIVGINGPPGTGKTTLLRDVVAKVVLDRAVAMAEFDDPEDAFIHQTTMKAGQAFLHLYRLADSLLGHEMVVASSNNKAVENVSREIPLAKAIADDTAQIRYFASIADRVARQKGEDSVEEGRCWGLAAAVLGNSANRHGFSQGFWWDPDRSLRSYLRGIVDGWEPRPAHDSGTETDEETRPAAVLELEQAPRDLAAARKRWRSVRKGFLATLERAEEIQRDLVCARDALLRQGEAEAALAEAGEAVRTSRLALEEAAEQLREAAIAAGQARRAAEHAAADREAVQVLRPGFFARLFGTRSYREWREMMSGSVSVLSLRQEEERQSQAHLDAARRHRDEAHDRLRRAGTSHESRARELECILAVLAQARKAQAEHFPDARFWELPEDERQRLSPWLTEAFQTVRQELFKAAFEVHRAFIDAAARRLRHNLGAAMALLKGRGLSAAQEPARRSIWASLFLVVPVISTTFASVDRLFGPLGAQQLGWLLLDEAGQAAPQAAVGAIWRSQRVVAIGDPLQIEPVTALPQRLIDAIFHEVGVDADLWSAPRNSVQSLADRVSWFGTRLSRGQGDVWVGAPLRVHRRCEEPMFRISNRVAYEGLMVQATPTTPSPIGDVIGSSTWFDVPGALPGHWSEAEGDVAAKILEVVLRQVGAGADLFFITPFRLSAAKLRERLHPLVAATPETPKSRHWTRDRVGTIHTVQGREAEAVVLVLGAPSPQNAGARRWAGGTPNLLNVAVSRAKQRLYVVGSHESWKDAGVFRALASALPRRPVGASGPG